MDKYEYKIRSDEIKSLIAKGDYAQAAEIADTIDWRRVKSVMMLCTISDLYKINRRYEDAKNMLLLAYERRPGGRTICYSLCELCIKTEDLVQALKYYKEFVQVAPKDTGRFILQYKIYEAQEVSIEERIGVLEELKRRDYREKWAYELAYLYHRMGLATRCVEECDELILWFGDGKYVVKAMELKMLHQPLTPAQQDIYDHRFEEASQEDGAGSDDGEFYEEPADYGQQSDMGEEGYGWGPEDGQYAEDGAPGMEGRPFEDMDGRSSGDMDGGFSGDMDGRSSVDMDGRSSVDMDERSSVDMDDMDIHVKTMDVGQYNTINLQAELAAGLQEVLGAEETAYSDQDSQGQPEMEIVREQEGYGDLASEEMEESEVFFGATGEIEDMAWEAEAAGAEAGIEPGLMPGGGKAEAARIGSGPEAAKLPGQQPGEGSRRQLRQSAGQSRGGAGFATGQPVSAEDAGQRQAVAESAGQRKENRRDVIDFAERQLAVERQRDATEAAGRQPGQQPVAEEAAEQQSGRKPVAAGTANQQPLRQPNASGAAEQQPLRQPNVSGAAEQQPLQQPNASEIANQQPLRQPNASETANQQLSWQSNASGAANQQMLWQSNASGDAEQQPLRQPNASEIANQQPLRQPNVSGAVEQPEVRQPNTAETAEQQPMVRQPVAPGTAMQQPVQQSDTAETAEREPQGQQADAAAGAVRNVPQEDLPVDETARQVMEQMRSESVEGGQVPRELAEVLSQEANGQISLVLPESAAIEKQITGQMKIDDILMEWERMKKENEEKRKEEVRMHILHQTGPMFTEFEAAIRDGLLEQLEKGTADKEDGTRPEQAPAGEGKDSAQSGAESGEETAASVEGIVGGLPKEGARHMEAGLGEAEAPESGESAAEASLEYIEEDGLGDELKGMENGNFAQPEGSLEETGLRDGADYPDVAGAEDGLEYLQGQEAEEKQIYAEADLEKAAGYGEDSSYWEALRDIGATGTEAAYEDGSGYGEDSDFIQKPEGIGETEKEDRLDFDGEASYENESDYGDGTGYGEELGYGDGIGCDEESGYGDGTGYGEEAGYGDGTGYGEEPGHGDGTGYREGAGYGDRTGYDEAAGYGGGTGYGERSGYDEEPGYGDGTNYIEESGYRAGTSYGEEPSYGNLSEEDEAGYRDLSAGDESSYGDLSEEDEVGYGDLPGEDESSYGNLSGEDEVSYRDLPQEDESGYGDLSEEDEVGYGDLSEEDEVGYGNLSEEDEVGYEDLSEEDEVGYRDLPEEGEFGYGDLPDEDESDYGDLSDDSEEAGYGELSDEESIQDADIIEEIEEKQKLTIKADKRPKPARLKKQKAAKSSETEEEQPIERDQEKIRSLSREEKELFAPFIQNRRSKEQLIKAIDSLSMAAYTGNLIVTGEEGIDMLTLAKNIVRDVQVTDRNFSGKVAKITGQGLNGRNIEETLERLNNGALIIETASGMRPETAARLHRSLQQERVGIIVIMEDTKKAMKKLLLGTPELYGDFSARIDLEALSNDTLVSFGRQYAREMEYSIDDLGILALHTRIEELQTIDHVVTVAEVKQIVDEAIHHASRKTLGHFFDVLLARRYDDEDMIILTEKDFVA